MDPNTPAALTEDHVHVLLDAVTTHTEAIEAAEKPWTYYDGDPADDPKLTQDGYLRLLGEAREVLGATLNAAGQLMLIPDHTTGTPA